MKPLRLPVVLIAIAALAGCAGNGSNPLPVTVPPAGSYVGTWTSDNGQRSGTLSVVFSADGHAYGTGTVESEHRNSTVSVYGELLDGKYRAILMDRHVLADQWYLGKITVSSDGHIHGQYRQNLGDFDDRILIDLAPGGDNVVPNPPPGTAIPQGHFVGDYDVLDVGYTDTIDITVSPEGQVTGTITGDSRGTGTVTGTLSAQGALDWSIAFPGSTSHATSNIFTVFIDRLIGLFNEDGHVISIDVRRG